MARRRKSNKVSYKSIFIGILVVLFLVMITQCSDKSSKRITATATMTAEILPVLSETPPAPTETKLSGMDAMNATRWMRHTEVQPTIERRFIEQTMWTINLMTEIPTMHYLSTVSKQETQAVQQATVDALFTETAVNK